MEDWFSVGGWMSLMAVGLHFKAIACVFTVLAGSLVPGRHAQAATLEASLSPEYLGRTSRGGVNQPFANYLTGSFSGYGDVWNSSYIFDLALFRSAEVTITSARLVLDVASFQNDRAEEMVFSLGSFTGDLERLRSLVFRSPDFRTDRRLYEAMMGTVYGATIMPASLSSGDTLTVEFNANGLAALNALANGSGDTDIGMAGSFGYPTYQGGANQLLSTTNAKLMLEYHAVAEDREVSPVPLPASSLLMMSTCLGAGFFIRRRRT